jgi:hypothetical protein
MAYVRGVPDLPWILALGSLVLAAVFGAGIGVPRTLPAGARGTVIRWAHAVVWVLLAGMSVALALGPSGASVYPVLGLGALVLYLAYLATLFGSAKRR